MESGSSFAPLVSGTRSQVYHHPAPGPVKLPLIVRSKEFQWGCAGEEGGTFPQCPFQASRAIDLETVGKAIGLTPPSSTMKNPKARVGRSSHDHTVGVAESGLESWDSMFSPLPALQ